MSSWLADAHTIVSPECQDVCPCLSSMREEGMNGFEKRRKDAVSHAIIVKLIWICSHVVIICSLSAADTALTWAWKLSRITYLVAYVFLVITTISFYIALCLANPGYLQKGVHALSTVNLKRDSQKEYSDDVEAAEMGISGLAHIDIGMGRRLSGQHREIQKVVNDRGSTSGNGVGFAAENESCKGTWHVNISCQNEVGEEPSTSMSEAKEELQSLLAGGELIPRCVMKKHTVRTRGSSLGSIAEFSQIFKSGSESGIRKSGTAADIFSGEIDRRHGPERSISDPDKLEDACTYLERRPSKPASPVCVSPTRRRHERQFSWWEGPNPGRWCEFCGAWQLLRSRHCHDCARCVRRFDHHCTWIGSCIGQDNHLLFWWYLVVQLTLLCWTLQISVGAFHLPVALTIGRTAVLLYCLIPTAVMTVFVAALLAYHTLLVLTAQTTFELMLGHSSNVGPSKVAYLQHLPRDARPFSLGLFQNIIEFCCARQSKTYQMPAALSARRSVS